MKIVLNNNNKGNTFCKVINLINFLKVDSRWINVMSNDPEKYFKQQMLAS
jgi:hypothetical protein